MREAKRSYLLPASLSARTRSSSAELGLLPSITRDSPGLHILHLRPALSVQYPIGMTSLSTLTAGWSLMVISVGRMVAPGPTQGRGRLVRGPAGLSVYRK